MSESEELFHEAIERYAHYLNREITLQIDKILSGETHRDAHLLELTTHVMGSKISWKRAVREAMRSFKKEAAKQLADKRAGSVPKNTGLKLVPKEEES